ncbi:MAG TPA: methyltransferase domain-containing protein [Gemmataceae bacterium]
MPFLVAERRRQPEWMDQPDLDAQRHEQALQGLARINSWSGGGRVFWPKLRALAHVVADRPLRVLDLACGGGDGVIRLWRHAMQAGISLHIEGCDRSSTAIDHARRAAQSCDADVSFFSCDVLHDSLPEDYDVVLNSLFLHHLDEAEAVTFLRRAASVARRAFLISDLLRSPVGLVLAYAATRILTRSPVVHFDGPASVRGAFTLVELRSLARRAGLANATVTRHLPCHMFLSWNQT